MLSPFHFPLWISVRSEGKAKQKKPGHCRPGQSASASALLCRFTLPPFHYWTVAAWASGHARDTGGPVPLSVYRVKFPRRESRVLNAFVC